MPKASHVTSTPSVDRRSILAGAAGVAVTGALSTVPANAIPVGTEPSADYRELQRLSKLWAEAVEISSALGGDNPETRAAEAHQNAIGDEIDTVETRVMSRPPKTPGNLLDRAAFTLFWSDAFCRTAFDDPCEALKRQAEKGDCFESRALLLAAAVFEAAGMANVAA